MRSVVCLVVLTTLVSVTTATKPISLQRIDRHRFVLDPLPDRPTVAKRSYLPHAFRPSLSPNTNFVASSDPRIEASIPLDGGVAFGELYIGVTTASQSDTFNVQVDTGSSDFAVISTKVSGYSSLPHYDPFSSSSASPLSCSYDSLCDCSSAKTCQYEISYLDGSGYTALVFNDTLSAGSVSGVDGFIGAIIKESKGFESPPVAGIMGVAYSSESSVNTPTFVDSVVAQSPGALNQFSMCVPPPSASNAEGSMIIGSATSRTYSYTPIIDQSFYVVEIESMSVGSSSLPVSKSILNENQAIVDSGTTELLVPSQAYAAAKKVMKSMCADTDLVGVCGEKSGQGLFGGYCFEMVPSDIAKFPTISFGLSRGLTLDVPPTSYLSVDSSFDGEGTYYCLGMVSASEVILGDVVMQGRDTVFDRRNGRVGFANVDSC